MRRLVVPAIFLCLAIVLVSWWVQKRALDVDRSNVVAQKTTVGGEEFTTRKENATASTPSLPQGRAGASREIRPVPGISGRVRLANGMLPPKGTRVRASTTAWGERPSVEEFEDGVEVEPDGSFTLEESAGFRGRVFAHAKNHAVSGSREFLLGHRHLSGLGIVLEPGVTVGGVVLSPRGEAVSGARVRVKSLSGNSHVDLLDHHETFHEVDGDGMFRVSGVPPGEIEVIATALNFAPSDKRVQYMEDGDSALGIKLVLAEATGKGGSATAGRVIDEENNQPIAGVQISLMASLNEPPIEVTTDAEGKFFHPGPDFERRRLTDISHPLYHGPEYVNFDGSGGYIVPLKRKPPPVSYIGKLIDSETGEPVLNARYKTGSGWDSESYERQSSPNKIGDNWRSADHGMILIDELMYAEDIYFRIEADGYQWVSRRPDTGWQGTPEILEEEIKLSRLGRLTGRLIDSETGRPLVGVPVRFDQFAVTDDFEEPLATRSGADGRFVFDDIASTVRLSWASDAQGPGPFLIVDPPPPHAMLRRNCYLEKSSKAGESSEGSASDSPFGPYSGRSWPNAGENRDLGDIPVGKGRTIKVIATDQSGPQTGVGLMLSDYEGHVVGPIFTDNSGVATFRGVGYFPFTRIGLADERDQFTFNDNLEDEQEVLLPIGSASLTIITRRGERNVASEIRFRRTKKPEGEERQIARRDFYPLDLDSPGLYRLSHVPSGEFVVEVRPTGERKTHLERLVLRPGGRRVVRVEFQTD